MKRIILMLSCTTLFILNGCGLKTYTSGIMKMGPDTYTVSANDLNLAIAQSAAMDLANKHCEQLNKEILVTNRIVTNSVRQNYEVTFMCLSKLDAELQRPKYENKPDIIIQNK